MRNLMYTIFVVQYFYLVITGAIIVKDFVHHFDCIYSQVS